MGVYRMASWLRWVKDIVVGVGQSFWICLASVLSWFELWWDAVTSWIMAWNCFGASVSRCWQWSPCFLETMSVEWHMNSSWYMWRTRSLVTSRSWSKGMLMWRACSMFVWAISQSGVERVFAVAVGGIKNRKLRTINGRHGRVMDLFSCSCGPVFFSLHKETPGLPIHQKKGAERKHRQCSGKICNGGSSASIR